MNRIRSIFLAASSGPGFEARSFAHDDSSAAIFDTSEQKSASSLAVLESSVM